MNRLIRSLRSPPLMLLWAARDLLRHPGESLLVGAALSLVVTLLGVALLLTQALTGASSQLMAAGPELLVRRLDAGGWAPMPVEAVEKARQVAGITEARGRVWGIVQGPRGPVTVVGLDEGMLAELKAEGLRPPKAGEAVAGAGAYEEVSYPILPLSGQVMGNYVVVGTFPARASLATQDVVGVTLEDARALLGLGPDQASDLALRVFHPEEAEAVRADLAEALGFPLRMTTRQESLGALSMQTAQRGGLLSVVQLPVLLALALLVAGVVRDRLGKRSEVGLLKALGWTTRDVVRLQAARGLVIGLPALSLGALAAWLLVFWPGITWPARLLGAWSDAAPPLYLDARGASLVLLQVLGLVGAPWAVATLWPALRGAAADPQDLLQGERF